VVEFNYGHAAVQGSRGLSDTRDQDRSCSHQVVHYYYLVLLLFRSEWSPDKSYKQQARKRFAPRDSRTQ